MDSFDTPYKVLFTLLHCINPLQYCIYIIKETNIKKAEKKQKRNGRKVNNFDFISRFSCNVSRLIPFFFIKPGNQLPGFATIRWTLGEKTHMVSSETHRNEVPFLEKINTIMLIMFREKRKNKWMNVLKPRIRLVATKHKLGCHLILCSRSCQLFYIP